MHRLLLENEMASFPCCHLMACQEQQVSRVKSGVRTLSQGREKKKRTQTARYQECRKQIYGGRGNCFVKYCLRKYSSLKGK